MPALLACLTGPEAQADFFESILDIDYGRRLLPGPDAPYPAVGALPGFSDPVPGPLPYACHDACPNPPNPEIESGPAPARLSSPGASDSGLASPPRLRADAGLRHTDFIRRNGPDAVSHGRTESFLDVAAAPAPGLELRFAAEGQARDLAVGDPDGSKDPGDSGVSADAGGKEWGWRMALSFPFTGYLVPSIVAGSRSSNPRMHALRALAFRGLLPGGWSWSLAVGRENRDFPVRIDLPDYEPISLPFLSRQDFREAGLAYARGRWKASWTGRWTTSRNPRVRPEGASLADSAEGWRHAARVAFAGSATAVSLDFDMGMGRHVFRGSSVRKGTATPFSWLRGDRADYGVRADLARPWHAGNGQAAGGSGWGAWLAAGEAEYDALEPEVPYGHWFWDRNGVLDSYQGSLLGVFSGETWMFAGKAYAGYAGSGIWLRGACAGFGYRISAGYQYLILKAESHLTRRRTLLLLGYSESASDRVFPTVEADLVPIGLDLTRGIGNFEVTLEGRAALPARIRTEGGSGKDGSDDPGSEKARYRGGTRAGLRVGYRMR